MALTRPTLAQLTTGIARISDPITTLHAGFNTANVDIGFLMNRANGLVSNVALYWNESGNTFVTAFTTNTGETNTNVAISSFANLSVGNLIANSGVYATSFNFANGLPFTTSTYSNANVTAYLPTDATITAIQSNVTAANAAIVTANSAVVSYVNSLNTSMIGNVNAANSAIVTANTGMKSYVDAVTTAWTANAGSQQTQINTLQTQVYSNTNVAAYLPTYNGTVTGTFSGTAAITSGTVNGTSIGATTASSGRFTTITGTDSTPSTSTNTGAVTISGGLGVLGNVWIGGNLYVANVIATTTNQLVVSDPLVYFQNPSPSPYNFDLGFYSDFIGGPSNIYGHTGLVRKQSANAWVFFSNINSEPSATAINWNDSGLIYDALIVGNIVAANTTAASSTTTGALIVAGGAGIAGQLYAGGFNTSGGSVLGTATATNFSTANASISGGNAAFTTLTATNFSSANVTSITGTAATLVVTNLSSGNAVITGGSINGTTVGATTASTGAFTSLSASGPLYVSNTTTSTTGNTGALIVAGGAGIAGNVYAGNVYTGGLYWASNGAVISTGGGGTGITYTASTTAPISPKVGDQWYYTTGDILYEYQNVGTGSFWIDITSPTISSGTVTVPGGDAFSPFLLMGA